MSSMYFKDILIADVDKHTARYVEFQQGLNVITSTDNHVGKSSLLKSLYYAMGAEVKFDNTWGKSTKVTAVRVIINNQTYRFVRFLRRYAVFHEETLVLLTDSVTKGLAPKLEELFNFSIYLAEKSDARKIIQAPPAFTFMPYYIDQDIGWKGLYESFLSLDQFEKNERIKSIYFHLGLYNRSTIEKMGERDRYKNEIIALQKREKDIRITLDALLDEIENLVIADNEDELEKHLIIPKERIAYLVDEAGKVRNRIQELQTTLQQHEYQLSVIIEYKKIKTPEEHDTKSIHVCPRCGYEFDDEIYSLVRNGYNQSNEEYLLQQIQMIIGSIKEDLRKQETEYIRLMTKLQEQEKAYDETQDAYDAYIRHRGLRETVRKLQMELDENTVAQRDKEEEIKTINKELRNIEGKKDIEDNYIENVKRNIVKLSAWDSSFEGKFKLLTPITAQGSLEGKIVLSQYVGLFQTMDGIRSSVIRFPFVVDSPRGNEASDASSRDILDLIVGISSLPQVIMATVDYEKYKVSEEAKIIKLVAMKKLLDEDTYIEKEEEIESLYSLLNRDWK